MRHEEQEEEEEEGIAPPVGTARARAGDENVGEGRGQPAARPLKKIVPGLVTKPALGESFGKYVKRISRSTKINYTARR